MKKIISILACGALLMSSMPLGAFAEEKKNGDDVIAISTAEEFVAFSKNCNIDSFSEGKKFVLTADIELTHSGFETIPYFAGSFDGAGHTVSGLRITSEGSVKGLFRYTSDKARIINLNVRGRVIPGGTRCTVGGIVGENSGELLRCTFDGNTSGVKCVGGIAGINTETGIINACSFAGETSGEHRVGGIAGENRGIITACTNSAEVNTKEIEVTTEKTFGLTALDSIRESKKDVSELSEENFRNISDIGGITGLSAGVAEKCLNTGKIGYEHMGYNVGGIAGRSSGRLAGCENKGDVLGRKDVGGIAGQIEPFACWDFSDSKVAEFEGEIGDLQEQIGAMIDNGEEKGEDARKSLKEINTELKAARAELDKIRKQTSGDISASQKSIEEMRGIVSDYLNELSESAENLDKYAGDAKKTIGKIASDTADSVQKDLEGKKNLAEGISSQTKEILNKAADDTGLKEYSEQLSQFAEKLKNYPDSEKAAELMNLLKSEIDSETHLQISMIEESRLIREELKNGDIIGLIGSLKELKNFKSKLMNNDQYLQMLKLMHEIDLPETDISQFETYYSNMKKRADNLEADIDALIMVLSRTSELFEVNVPDIDTSKLVDIIDEMSGNISTERERELVDKMREAAAGMTFNVPDTNELVSHLKKAGDEMSKLADKTVNDDSTAKDINTVRESLSQVLDRFSGTVEDVATVKANFESDISDDGERSLSGTIKDCKNNADINGDSNVGGIAGSMAFEIDFDAEDQLNISQYMLSDARYLIYTVIDGCSGSGDIYAKKECAGGIIGSMDFGTVKNCLSVGMVKVASGDYCGGTAGKSAGTIKNCSSRTVLGGGKYVGGIVGSGSIIENCMVYSYIDSAKEYAGSTAGYVEKEVKGCFFVENGVGGIDGVSKTGVAEPLSYEQMISRTDVPDEFKKITVTFIANGKDIAEVEVPFGGKLNSSDIPEVEKDGVRYWKWDDIGTDEIYYSCVVHGSYVDPITTISTEGDQPQFLAEGIFYEGQQLTAEPLPDNTDRNASYKVTVNGDTAPLKIRFRSSVKDGELLVSGAAREYVRDGSYIVFDMENGGDFVYRPAEKKYDVQLIVEISAGAAVIIIMITVLIASRKKAKGSKKAVSGKK